MEVYDFPFLALVAVLLSLPLGLILLSLHLLKQKSNAGNFLVSIKIWLVWVLHICIGFIALAICQNSVKGSTARGIAAVFSTLICIFSSVVCAAGILYKSKQSNELSSILQVPQKSTFSSSLEISVMTFLFTTIAISSLFLGLYLIGEEIDRRNPKPKVTFGLYDI
jgi:hypothetical protein